ncbi:hypothetical protein Tco_0803239 [Tanacetum coccineum]|uniref:Uncharacterized protein n=1 Tax=Tanacetum coccineum TaxID=301880 RepID=A0ABQ5A3R1_9ASTR
MNVGIGGDGVEGDCKLVLKEIVSRLLEEEEKLEWWFNQDIDEEEVRFEGDEDGDEAVGCAGLGMGWELGVEWDGGGTGGDKYHRPLLVDFVVREWEEYGQGKTKWRNRGITDRRLGSTDGTIVGHTLSFAGATWGGVGLGWDGGWGR